MNITIGLAGMLIGIGVSLIAQHWAVAVLGAVVVIIFYVDTYEEERSCLAKFGEAYEKYMQRVPRANFILGIVRLLLPRPDKE